MAADLQIHVLEGVSEEDVAAFCSHTFGSKHFNLRVRQSDDLFDRIANTPHVWIGEVSWLKAAVLDDPASFVPGPVQKITKLIGEDLPLLDEALTRQIMEALRAENATQYSIAKPDDVAVFLRQHQGKRLFAISW